MRMRKLALSDEILLSIQQPARYIGGEINSVCKDPSSVDVRFAMCFPDVYDIGMSHLGIQILYDMLNKMPDVVEILDQFMFLLIKIMKISFVKLLIMELG